MQPEQEEHTFKLSSQYRNTNILQRSLSFGKRAKKTAPTVQSSVETVLYKRSGWKYVPREFSVRNGDLCYRNADRSFTNAGRVVTSVVVRESMLEFHIYTTQREYRMRAPDQATLREWIKLCRADE